MNPPEIVARIAAAQLAHTVASARLREFRPGSIQAYIWGKLAEITLAELAELSAIGEALLADPPNSIDHQPSEEP